MDFKTQLKISIITVSYNSAATIKETIDSLSSQMNVFFEHILIDGGSTDNTLEIAQNSLNLTVCVSEPDKGIYDAMNKGIRLASGDVIGILNSDDMYANSYVLEKVAKIFSNPHVDACYADLVYVSQYDSKCIIRHWRSRPYRHGLFKSGWMPAHPTFFVRRRIYEQYGLFNIRYRIAADFELMFRLIEIAKIRTYYLPEVLVRMRMGGKTNASISNIISQNKEIIQCLKAEYTDFSIIGFIITKLYSRLRQFLIPYKVC